MTEENDYCSACNGSGEGQHDGSNCPACNGRGVQVDSTQQQEQEAYQAELRYEEMKYGY